MAGTVLQLPPDVDKVLQDRARSEGKDPHELALEVMKSGLGMENPAQPRRTPRDFSFFTFDEETARLLDEAKQRHEHIDRE
jgi:hypothetical protein